MKIFGKLAWLLLVAFAGTTLTWAQKDVAGSSDLPIISRFKGSVIAGQDHKDFDSYLLPLGVPQGDHFRKQQNVEGKVTRTLYLAPPGSSPLLVYRNYETALKQAGVQVLFSCVGSECRGDGTVAHYYESRWGSNALGGNSFANDARVLVTKLSRPGGAVYVSLCSAELYSDPSRVYTAVDVIETKDAAAGLVTVNAAELASDITQSGHAAVYGIYFDTGKAELKPESDATLLEISKLLATNPKMKLHVVGHTDNVGTLAANMTLSKQRADAVVAALGTKYHVAAARLDAAGVGPLAPVTNNKTEDGRAQNRRVELVEQ